MKKLLLIAAATAALSTSAMADERVASSTKTGFYVRGDVGAYLNTQQKVDEPIFDNSIKLKKNCTKP